MSTADRLALGLFGFASSEPAPRVQLARAIAPSALLLSLLGSGNAWADPSSFSQSRINDIRTSTPAESNGTTSSSVSDGPNSAASFLFPAVGTMGAAVISDGSVVGVSTATTHVDDWTCGSGASCAVAGPMRVTIEFDASFGGRIGEFSWSRNTRSAARYSTSAWGRTAAQSPRAPAGASILSRSC